MDALTSNNRVNIPAVCRLRSPTTDATAGTGILVAPGILLTSTAATGSVNSCERLVATFFEGTKKKPIDAKLLPSQLYFAAAYPEYMDYCLVAVESAPVYNVTPVTMPVVRQAWPTVGEGDVLLVVQHPIASETSVGRQASPAAEEKRFQEVRRTTTDVMYFQPSGTLRTAGCPVFNDEGRLVGLQSQLRSTAEGVVSRAVFLSSIVKHLFANGQLSALPVPDSSFEDIWDTWYIDKDVARIVSILANFKGKEMVCKATQRLCELTGSPDTVRRVADSGGMQVIISNLRLFPDDKDLAMMALRALWNMSVGEDVCLYQIVESNGVELILSLMESFPEEITILEFGTVLLFNIASSSRSPNFSGSLGQRTLNAVLPAALRHRDTVVLQKFSFSLFTRLIRLDKSVAVTLAENRAVEHCARVVEQHHKHVFLMEVLTEFVAELVQSRPALEASCKVMSPDYPMPKVIGLVIDIMLEYEKHEPILVQGNRALWGIGNDLHCRTVILSHPQSAEAFRISLPAIQSIARRL